MNKKKIWKYGLSLLLVFALLAGIFPVKTLQMEEVTAAVTEGKEAVCYVSASGSDSYDGQTAATAYATLSKAITDLNATSGVSKRTIRIVGEYTWSRDAFAATSTYTNTITITGVDRNAVMVNSTNSNMWHPSGPVRFENIRLRLLDGNLLTLGRKWIIGEGVTVEKADGTALALPITTGGYSASTPLSATEQCLEINSGSFGDIYLGNHYWQGSDCPDVAGAEFVLNGGTVSRVLIGEAADSGGSGKTTNKYTQNVNVIINGGTITNGISLSEKVENTTSFDSGVAVQIICNNGTPAPTITENLASDLSNLYILECEKEEETHLEGESSTLVPTDTAGVFQIAGKKMRAKATKLNADGTSTGLTFSSNENGTLDLTQAGAKAATYAVTWEILDVYVDAVNGSDEQVGASGIGETPGTAFKTLNKAMQYLTVRTNASGYGVKRINIIGEYELQKIDTYDFTAHSAMFIIRGVDSEGNVVNITRPTETQKAGEPTLVLTHNSWVQGGPICFENICLRYAYGTPAKPGSIGFYMLRNKVILGENVVVRSDDHDHLPFASKYQSILALGTNYSTGNADMGMQPASNGNNFTMYDGNLYTIYLGDNYIEEGLTQTVEDAYFEMNGGELVNLSLAGDGKGTQTYNGSIKIMVNGGHISNAGGIQIGGSAAGRVSFKRAIEIVANYGNEPHINEDLTKDNVNQYGGEYYALFCEEVFDENGNRIEECRLDFTDIPGEYKVPEGWIALAVNADDITDVRRSNPHDNILYLSENAGKTKQGTYHVFFEKDDCEWWVAGGILQAKEDCTIDLTTDAATPYWEDRIFLGWSNLTTQGLDLSDYKTVSFTKGQSLTALYMNYDESVEFASEGAQIIRGENDAVDTQVERLRFRVRINESLAEELDTAIRAVTSEHTTSGGLGSGSPDVRIGMYELGATAGMTAGQMYDYPNATNNAGEIAQSECTSVKVSEEQVNWRGTQGTRTIHRYVQEISDIQATETAREAKYATRAYLHYKDIHNIERTLYTQQIHHSVETVALYARGFSDAASDDFNYFHTMSGRQ